jgi:hypothetical protein
MIEPVPVRVRDCACPGTPHGEEGDIVLLAPKPSLACGLAAQGDMIQAGTDGKLLYQLWRVTYLRHGVVGWNLVDDRGKPVPLDIEELLSDYELAGPAAEKADELYGEVVLRPLLARLQAISPDGPTDDSTSPRLQSIPSRRSPSSPATSAGSRRRTA